MKKYVVSIPLSWHSKAEEAAAQQDEAHMLKFLLPKRVVGKVLGQGGHTKMAYKTPTTAVLRWHTEKTSIPGWSRYKVEFSESPNQLRPAFPLIYVR